MLKEAVIVSGGEKKNLPLLIGEKTEAKKLIGVDAGALALIAEGYEVDAAVGDFDSISPSDFELLKEKVPVVCKLPSEKDLTDTEAALEYVKENLQADEITMLGMLGGRIDHLLSNIWIAYHPSFQDILEKIKIVDQQNTIRFYRPGRYQIEKEADKKYLSFISMSKVTGLKLKEVKYPLLGSSYAYPIALVSNEFLGNRMEFSFEEGLLAVIQSRDS